MTTTITITKKIPVPTEYSLTGGESTVPTRASDLEYISSIIRNKYVNSEFTSVGEITIPDEHPSMSKMSPFVFYNVTYTIIQSLPVAGEVYTGPIVDRTCDGVYVNAPFRVFARGGFDVPNGSIVSIRLIALKMDSAGENVGELLDSIAA